MAKELPLLSLHASFIERHCGRDCAAPAFRVPAPLSHSVQPGTEKASPSFSAAKARCRHLRQVAGTFLRLKARHPLELTRHRDQNRCSAKKTRSPKGSMWPPFTAKESSSYPPVHHFCRSSSHFFNVFPFFAGCSFAGELRGFTAFVACMPPFSARFVAAFSKFLASVTRSALLSCMGSVRGCAGIAVSTSCLPTPDRVRDRLCSDSTHLYLGFLSSLGLGRSGRLGCGSLRRRKRAS